HHLTNMQRDMELLLPLRLHLNDAPALFTESQPDPAILEVWHQLLECIPANLPPLNEVIPVYEAVEDNLAVLRERLNAISDPSDQVKQAQSWCANLAESLTSARLAAHNLLFGFRDLSAQAEAQFHAMDFSFLFDPQREIFH